MAYQASSLELEAADYFKLDSSQVQMFGCKISSNTMAKESIAQEKMANQPAKMLSTKTAPRRLNQRHQSRKQETRKQLKMSNNLRVAKQLQVGKKPSEMSQQRRTQVRLNASEYNSTVLASSHLLPDSSTTSTNSLPSISSSPSVSPSLVCPHLSLDDILSQRVDSKSPHTIGLCARCRLNPPPDIHSPLSPAFKPSMDAKVLSQPGTMKRGYSDHQAIVTKSGVNRQRVRRLMSGFDMRDDSLDYYLEPKELRRLQMSPSMRHSVEFIRNNSLEAGRVLRVYKNGQPFDKPLRVCITRDEFSSLNHLLDHINGRQLIPSGARYLFHLDGQLVYSINELKHDSIYVVSGTRSFDLRAANAIKDEERRRQQMALASSQKLDARIHFEPTNHTARRPSTVQQTPSINDLSDNNRDQIESVNSIEVAAETKVTARKTHEIPINLSDNKPQTTSKVAVQKVNKPPVAVERRAKVSLNKRNEPKEMVRVEDEMVSKSNEHLARDYAPQELEERPIEKRTLVRAKSELSALPNKRKKNVTFEDTGRGSSPAIISGETASDYPIVEQPPVKAEQDSEQLNTNEIGIQVSDTIEGYLIDLPLAIPRKPGAYDDEQPARRKPVRPRVNSKPAKAPIASPRRQQVGHKPAKKKIVTISERQLSLEEMDQLKDLDHGDHHSDLHKIEHVTIKLDAASLTEQKDQELSEQVVFPEGEDQPETDSQHVIESSQEAVRNDDPRWQSPTSEGDCRTVNTPIERPVSQSEANESVHARVTTPTPSMSTAGDTSSLSYENQSGGELASRSQVPVCGRLCPNGLDPPTRNFRLVWVNGFAINNHYPENSLRGVAMSAGEQQQVAESGLLLSPSSATSGRQSLLQFKPNDRFPNWVAHSRNHDELLFPAGCLVVLWCRSSGEQRFYGAHTSNVSALALASSDADLAASAQEPDESMGKVRASLHLWSLSSLATLHVLEDEQFASKRVFTIQLDKGEQDGSVELLLGSREDKRLWLRLLQLKLAPDDPGEKSESAKSKVMISSQFRTSKPLQANQVPLLVTRLASPQPSRQGEILLSFGRRHFQVWSPDRRKRDLNLLKADSKSAQISESIARANCLVRLAPSELIVGDAEGNLCMLVLSLTAADKYNIELVPLMSGQPVSKTLLTPAAITCLMRVSSNMFVSGDSNCTLRFWRIQREPNAPVRVECKQVRSVALPTDLGLICALVLSNYSRKRALVELYIVSTSNAILYGSMDLASESSNCTLSVVYEGHESWVMNLVADQSSRSSQAQFGDYFTCSLDCKICKWNGKSLLWKSLLPSACASLAVHPVGFVLAVGAADGTVYVLDKVSGLLISYFPLTPVCINCLAYSRDGSLLAAGCANGSIFILPVYEQGLKYKKVSIFQSPYPVVSLQFSLDNQYILTSVTHGSYQELILWDLPNFKYMRDNVELTADKIDWFDSICSGSEDVRAIWENANITEQPLEAANKRQPTKLKRSDRIVNLSCHRLIYAKRRPTPEETPGETDFVVASDTHGYLRMFRYPCYDTRQGFYEARVSSSAMNCCRFLANKDRRPEAKAMFVSCSLDGSIYLWTLD